MNEHLKLKAQRQPWSRRIGFVFFTKESNQVYNSTNIEFVKSQEAIEIEPTFFMNPEDVQELIDELWTIGFRPSEGTGSAGALAATQNHLEDMRKIAFDLLEKYGHK